jgi:PAS domain S-box-containing protein
MPYLDKSDPRLKLALQATNTGMWEWEIPTGRVAWSETLESLFGIAPGRLDGTYQSLLECIHADDRAPVTEAIADAIRSTTDYQIQFRVCSGDGQIRWLSSQGTVGCDEEQHRIRVTSVCQEIPWRQTSAAQIALEEVQDMQQRATCPESVETPMPPEPVSGVPSQLVTAPARCQTRWRISSGDAALALIQNSTDLITILAADGTILYESPAIERILGYCPDELIGRVAMDYVAPDDHKVVEAALIRLLASERGATVPPVVFRSLRKDGSWCYLEASGTNLLADEAVGGVVINSRDVTERIQTQEALRRSEMRFRAIFAGAALGIALSDPSGKLLECNPAMLKLLGYSEEELHQRTFAAITHPEDMAANSNLYQELLAGSVPSYQLEKRYFHKDGTLVWGRLTVSLVRDRAGAPLFAVGMIEDITAAKQAQAALSRISKAVENTSDAIGIADNLGLRLTYVNPAFEEMFGYTLEQLKEVGGAAILFSDAKIGYEVFAIAASGQSWQGEVEMLARDGVVKQIALRADAIKDAAGEVVGTIAIHTDITERKQAEAALRQSYHRAELLEKITTEIRSSLDTQHIFQATVNQVGQALQVNRCMIHLYREDPDRQLPLVAEYLEPGYSSLKDFEVPIQGNPHTEQLLATDRAFAIGDVNAEPLLESTVHLCRQMGIKSMLGIRTSYQGKPNGVIGLHQCDAYRHWHSDEIDLLEAVAAQVGIALAQACLLENETRTAAQLTQQNRALQQSEARERAKARELEQTLIRLQRTQAQLVQTEKMSSLGQLVAGVAHEINNPVSFITGNINYAKDYIQDLLHVLSLYREHYPQPVAAIQAEVEKIDLDFLMQDLPKLLRSMQVGADRIHQIVLSLRNFSRHDEAQMKPVDIHEGIKNTLLILQNRLKARGGKPEIQTIEEYGRLPLVECHAGQLNQVFMNLIGNAIDALETLRERDYCQTPSERIGGGIPREDAPCQEVCRLDENSPCLPCIWIRTQVKEDNRVSISIIDNGEGMTREVQQKLFNPFFTTKPVGKGTGLGLSISYQIVVEKHGGKLHCFSAPGQGTQFVIELPIQQSL